MAADPRLGEVVRALGRLRPRHGPFLVGVTGSVAAGKTTFAAALAAAFAVAEPRTSIEVVCTDGFLFPNAVLESRGLAARKGFPETYDTEAMAVAFAAVRKGVAHFPTYTHVNYDIDPDRIRRLDAPDILIVEGLGLRRDRNHARAVGSELDALVFLDAEEGDIETWFIERFLRLRFAALSDPGSFYGRFLDLDEDGATAMAVWIWRTINLPNLREHIFPFMAVADLTVRKSADHKIIWVREGPLAT
jgi:type I pantothenate kinase